MRNHKRKALVLVVLLTGFLFATKTATAEDDVSVKEIIQLHEDGITPDVINEHLEIIGTVEHITPEKAKKMKDRGVPESVIDKARALSETAEEQSDKSGTDQEKSEQQKPNQKNKPARKPDQPSFSFSNSGSEPLYITVDRSSKTFTVSTVPKTEFFTLQPDGTLYTPSEKGQWSIRTASSDKQLLFRIGEKRHVEIMLVSLDAGNVEISVYLDDRRIAKGRFETGGTSGKPRSDDGSRNRRRAGDEESSYESPADSFPYRSRYNRYYHSPSYFYYSSPTIIRSGTGFGSTFRSRRSVRHRHFGFRLKGNFEIGSVKGTFRFGSGSHRHHHHHR